MALISNAKGRKITETPSGYERLFGNRELGMLISKVQSAVISTGNELEEIIALKTKNKTGLSIKHRCTFSGIKQGHNIVVDCVVEKNKKTYLIEIKDGDTFDTKKVAGELESLKLVREHLKKKGINDVEIKFCSFNAKTHEQIKLGAKGLLNEGMAMTGREFCDLAEINFDEIVDERKADQKENLEHFKQELKKIKELND